MKEVADIWGGGMAEGGSFLAKLDAVSTRSSGEFGVWGFRGLGVWGLGFRV